jgi:hypothetical protein
VLVPGNEMVRVSQRWWAGEVHGEVIVGAAVVGGKGRHVEYVSRITPHKTLRHVEYQSSLLSLIEPKGSA